MSHSLAPTAVIPIEATLLVLGLVTALGRLIPRFLHRQSFTVSDCFLIASIGNAVALFITDVMTYRWGGMGESDASSDALAISLKKVQFAGNYFYDTGIYLPKLAIVALYFRLFPPTKPWLRKALYLVSGFTLASMITTCFLDTFWCGRNVSVNWSLDPEACSTFNSKVVFRIDWVMNITTDLLICALPFPLLHQLQLNRRQFWGLIVTFSLGVITIVVSVIRFTTIEVIQAWTNVFVLSMAETAVAIMVVSLPSMRGYLRGGRFFSSRQTYGHSSSDRHLRTPNRRSTSNNRRPNTRSPSNDDDTGSEIELNAMDNKNVIVETHEITVESAPATDNDRVAFGQ